MALGMIPGCSSSPVLKQRKVSTTLRFYGRVELTKVKVFPEAVCP
jgi:hypothetical protein